LLAALAIERLAAGWPDRALARLQRARDLAAFVRARTTGAPDKLKSAL
jgi:hypothetical protein